MNWDLGKLYTGFDDPAFARDMDALSAGAAQLKTAIANVREGDEQKNLHAIIERMQSLSKRMGRVSNLIFLTLAADSNCEAALQPRVRYMEIGNEFSLVSSDFVRYIGENDHIRALCEGDALLTEHLPFFENAKNDAAHLIDSALEPTVLKMRMDGSAAFARLRDELFAGLSIDLTLDGETKRLPLPAVRAMACDARADVRKAAYEAEIAAYPRLETGMAACLNAIKGEALTMCSLRNFPSVLDWSLIVSRMDRETLDALLNAMRGALPMFRRYFRLKAKMLGYEGGLKFYDLFAPVGKVTKTYTLDEARDLLLRVFGDYCPAIQNVMRRAFAENWIDAYPREGKEGGAFCAGEPSLGISYVLTNFDGSFSDVSTLAHELGHAFHNDCLNEVSPLMTDTPMPLAETASTFNELLLAERMQKLASPEEEAALLEMQLSDAAQVIVDIMSRFLFESEVVERRKTGTTSARGLCEIMLNAQKQTYGDGLDENCLHPYMWACKSHYYSADLHFYNFPYAFGLLFATGLYALWQKKGDDFWPLYKTILQKSGSDTIRNVAASAGIDLTRPDFWQDAIAFYAKKLDRLETLVNAESN